MRQTTRAGTHNSTGPLADAGPYEYDLPVARSVSQPVPAPAPARKRIGWNIAETLFIGLMGMGAQFSQSWFGWRLIHGYVFMYAMGALARYLSKPQPKQSFPQWLLRQLGIWLNCYIGFVTVPESLRGLLPDPLAFGLPAFLITAVMYVVAPIKPGTAQKWPLWQWLLFAAFCAVVWAWSAPFILFF